MYTTTAYTTYNSYMQWLQNNGYLTARTSNISRETSLRTSVYWKPKPLKSILPTKDELMEFLTNE